MSSSVLITTLIFVRIHVNVKYGVAFSVHVFHYYNRTRLPPQKPVTVHFPFVSCAFGRDVWEVSGRSRWGTNSQRNFPCDRPTKPRRSPPTKYSPHLRKFPRPKTNRESLPSDHRQSFPLQFCPTQGGEGSTGSRTDDSKETPGEPVLPPDTSVTPLPESE